MENLRAFLGQHNTEDPLQFGCKLKYIEPRGFMSGGAGYVLSKEALRRLVNVGLVRIRMILAYGKLIQMLNQSLNRMTTNYAT